MTTDNTEAEPEAGEIKWSMLEKMENRMTHSDGTPITNIRMDEDSTNYQLIEIVAEEIYEHCYDDSE